MKKTYEVADGTDRRAIAEFLKREGQFLLPMVELVDRAELAIDSVIEVMGRATIEAVLEMSAEAVAGPKQAGRARGSDDTRWYGRQDGAVYLSDRKVRIERPRLRRKGDGEGAEVEVPAYTAMKRPGALADRMLEILMAGVSTRKYGQVIPEMADTVGVSKSAVSRQTIEASERVLKELMERRLDAWDLLVIYVDGIQFGTHHILAAVGVDAEGKKHVLGIRQGASENTEVTSALLGDLVERGLDPRRRRLFVIDGSKALRKGIDQVFGSESPRAALPQPQAQERARASAQGSARSGEGGDPRGMEARCRRRRTEARVTRPLARARSPLGSEQPAGGPRRHVHDQPPRSALSPEEVPRHDESDRQHPLRHETENPQDHELEERNDGPEVGRNLLRRNRKEVPPYRWLRSALDPQSIPR